MESSIPPSPIPPLARAVKRGFDLALSAAGLVLTCWIIAPAFLASCIDTRKNGFFTQTRIGRNAKPFKVVKLRTMRDVKGHKTTVTTRADPRITRLGSFLRRAKIDELPQLFNVLLGQMSLVGPRPDVPGFADRLQGPDRVILSVRPGITGPATLRFRREEEELAAQADPERYNREVVFPEKVLLNRRYVENYSFRGDLKYILVTLFPSLDSGGGPPGRDGNRNAQGPERP